MNTTAAGYSWETRALCATNPPLWFATNPDAQRLALHACQRHCPVYTQCAADRTRRPCPFAVHAGILHNAHGQPVGTGIKPSGKHCPACRGLPDQKPTSRWPDCGTPAAYRRHQANRQDACDDCRTARRVYDQGKRAERAAREAGRPKPAAAPKRPSVRRTAAVLEMEAEQVAVIRKMAARGLIDRQIAVALRIHPRKVGRLRNAHGIPPGTSPRHIRTGTAA